MIVKFKKLDGTEIGINVNDIRRTRTWVSPQPGQACTMLVCCAPEMREDILVQGSLDQVIRQINEVTQFRRAFIWPEDGFLSVAAVQR